MIETIQMNGDNLAGGGSNELQLLIHIHKNGFAEIKGCRSCIQHCDIRLQILQHVPGRFRHDLVTTDINGFTFHGFDDESRSRPHEPTGQAASIVFWLSIKRYRPGQRCADVLWPVIPHSDT